MEFANVCLAYDGQNGFAVEDITLSIRPGEVVAIVGPPGCGKPTFMKLATSLRRCSSSTPESHDRLGASRAGRMTPPTAASAMPREDWHAHLELAFDASALGTRLALRRHSGPLVVQRPLYPEGPAVCHAIVVHPPGGIAGGDVLAVDVEAGAGAHALLTTPGAGKLYKSAGRVASQHVRLAARDLASIEWLPQESIVFDAAEASLGLDIDVAPGALVVAWEIVTLGREAMGERFAAGRLRTRLRVQIGDRLALWETGDLTGGGDWLASPAGWRNARSCGTLVVAGRPVEDGLLDQCRDAIVRWSTTSAVSRLEPSLLVARYLGPSAGEAREAFVALWRRIRPALAGREASLPRIWAT